MQVCSFRALSREVVNKFEPDIVMTMASYEFARSPNDHWAMAHGVDRAAQGNRVEKVLYFHSGRHYLHIHDGGEPIGQCVELSDGLLETKRKALLEYMRWVPEGGSYATAVHSAVSVFQVLFGSQGRYEYFSSVPAP